MQIEELRENYDKNTKTIALSKQNYDKLKQLGFGVFAFVDFNADGQGKIKECPII